MALIWQVVGERRNRDTASRLSFLRWDGLSSAVDLSWPKIIQSFRYAPAQCFHRSIKLCQNQGKRLLFCQVLLISLPGCCHWTDSAGTRHNLVLGFGVISVNESKPTAVKVTRATIVGLGTDDRGATVGYSSRFSTEVMAGAEDVRIEASQRPFAPIKIEIQKAQLNHTNQMN